MKRAKRRRMRPFKITPTPCELILIPDGAQIGPSAGNGKDTVIRGCTKLPRTGRGPAMEQQRGPLQEEGWD